MYIMANGLFRGGTGTEQDPYLVEDVADLHKVSEHYNANYNGAFNHYLQVSDIDLLGEAFIPVGGVVEGPSFRGVYDGGNYTIKNLHINNDELERIGLFADVSNGSVVKNLRAKNFAIKGNGNSQNIGLIGYLQGASTVTNIHLEDSELSGNGENTRSGFIGLITSDCIIKDVIVKNLEVSGNGDYQYLGLFAGSADKATIENVSLSGKVFNPGGNSSIGGFSGSASNLEVLNTSIKAIVEGSYYISGFCESPYDCVLVNCVIDGELKTAATNSSKASIFASTSSSTVVDKCLVLTHIEDNTVPSIFNTWGYLNNGAIITNSFMGAERAIGQWEEGKAYPWGRFVIGTDGKVYKTFRPQEADPVDDEEGLPIYTQPVQGEHWTARWELEADSSLISDEQLKNQKTFVGWDFENTWVMGANGPELKLFYKPSEEIPDDNDNPNDDDNDTPSDIVIVTDINFRKTKMIRDHLGSPIPQVWDHENKRWVPVTLQMVLFMANS